MTAKSTQDATNRSSTSSPSRRSRRSSTPDAKAASDHGDATTTCAARCTAPAAMGACSTPGSVARPASTTSTSCAGVARTELVDSPTTASQRSRPGSKSTTARSSCPMRAGHESARSPSLMSSTSRPPRPTNSRWLRRPRTDSPTKSESSSTRTTPTGSATHSSPRRPNGSRANAPQRARWRRASNSRTNRRLGTWTWPWNSWMTSRTLTYSPARSNAGSSTKRSSSRSGSTTKTSMTPPTRSHTTSFSTRT